MNTSDQVWLMAELARIRGLAVSNRALMDRIVPLFGRDVFETDANARHIRLVVACLDADVAFVQSRLLAHEVEGCDELVREARDKHGAAREAAYIEVYGQPLPSDYVWPVPVPY